MATHQTISKKRKKGDCEDFWFGTWRQFMDLGYETLDFVRRDCSSQSEPAIRTCDQNLLPVLDAVKFRLYEYTNRFTGTV